MAQLKEKVAEHRLEKKLVALVTDNAANMKAAWHILELDFPGVIFLGCLAHCLNLFLTVSASLPFLNCCACLHAFGMRLAQRVPLFVSFDAPCTADANPVCALRASVSAPTSTLPCQ